MDIYTLQEEAAKRGYRRGFGDGLAAAGIAPVQWRSSEEVPFVPGIDTDYLLIFRRCPDTPVMWTHWMIYAAGVRQEDVLFWCPVQLPAEVRFSTEEGGERDV